MKRSPFKPKKGKAWKTLKRFKPIARESKRRQRDHKTYTIRRKLFLEKHPRCRIKKMCNGAKAQVVCHLKGRGIYYLDESTWESGCWRCERWMTDNAKQAIKEGLAMDRIGKNKH